MTWWHPDRYAARRGRLKQRAAIRAAVRGWFEANEFMEVETPALQRSPGLEPHLMAVSAELVGPDGARAPRHLHTSPEFAMKKLLVAGEPRIFQLARVWRNGERGPTHHPEFTMLEWYRAGAALDDLVADCAGLLRAAAAAAGTDRLRWAGAEADPAAEPEILSVAEAFRRHCGIDLLATAPDPLAPDLALLAAQAAPLGVEPHPGDSWEDLFFRLSLAFVEPRLGVGRATVLTDYPVSMAALARPKPADPRVAERFELYVAGLELANAFGELTDTRVQRQRFEADRVRAQALYGRAYPVDEDFLAALDYGLPDSAGIALGFDRLVMLASGADHIDQVLWAPVDPP